MEIITRPMEPGEEPKVQKMGKRAFGGLEGIGIPKPRQAIVAVKDGKIVGAIQYKFYRAGGKKIGYFDYACIDPDYHNQGIGSILYKATADYLWEQGCGALTALVKDDNVGSWGLLLKNGFARISVPELTRQFGFLGMLRLYFGTVYSIAIGMDYYVALREEKRPSSKGNTAGQIGAYLLTNLLLFLVVLFTERKNFGAFFTAYGIFLVGGIVVGYAGTLFSKRRWHFRLCNGGGVVCAFVNLIGGVYPMVGNWYPDYYEKTDSFRKDMGVQAFTGWMFVLALSLVSSFVSGDILFQYLGYIGSVLLLYRTVAIYPFEAFGGGRVYRWKKGVYLVMTAVSLVFYAKNFIT